MALDGFLAGLPAGVQLFSLFEANPSLIDLIVDIAVDLARALARYLVAQRGRARCGDRRQFLRAPGPEWHALAAELARELAPANRITRRGSMPPAGG